MKHLSFVASELCAVSSDPLLKQQVETLYQQATGNEQEFCIDLEGEAPDGRSVWEWMGYSRKDNAKASLSRLIEGVDFLLLKAQEQTSGRGGHNRETAVFSRDGFKQWGMLAGTERGRQIRLYFIECERRLQLGMSQPTTMNQITDTLAELSSLVMGGFVGVKSDIKQIDDKVNNLSDRFDRFERKASVRKPARQKDRLAFNELVQSVYAGHCPCCEKPATSFEEDHWFDRSKNGRTEMWLVCKPCNRMLGTGGSVERQEHYPKYLAFQQLLKRLYKQCELF